ncbi:phosphonate C-P lyase system protein PhnG [Rhizobium sp. G21]|uniref:phosphonate C-P lyase system protein PhnG n=1 Tax=Rhizobium sp. G21 TaxID=2758439 RepID=UPI001600199D|nr:phosphonate C-P lyase system protein PhnG [Rhizobium sp. G21]MBB1248527.1 phosphonate C-P lyase system protein PhnG [Rhizobium sp. G21]
MTQSPASSDTDTQAAPQRKRRMDALARARRGELEHFLAEHAGDVGVSPVRGPETGLVMVRGKIGGGGSPFNLGEVSVSRASMRLSTGEIGHGQLLGGDKAHARLAAIIDAIAQRAEFSAAVDGLVASIEARVADEDAALAAETAATKVDFFTLVRGED